MLNLPNLPDALSEINEEEFDYFYVSDPEENYKSRYKIFIPKELSFKRESKTIATLFSNDVQMTRMHGVFYASKGMVISDKNYAVLGALLSIGFYMEMSQVPFRVPVAHTLIGNEKFDLGKSLHGSIMKDEEVLPKFPVHRAPDGRPIGVMTLYPTAEADFLSELLNKIDFQTSFLPEIFLGVHEFLSNVIFTNDFVKSILKRHSKTTETSGEKLPKYLISFAFLVEEDIVAGGKAASIARGFYGCL